jgi:serine/threonine protein kinase
MTAATKLPTLQDRVLGDFVLGEILGVGGFGTVYRAEQIGLRRPAVVKVIRRSLTTRREAVERFALEARLASHFDHPYAAHIYAFGVEPDGLMWIAMELVKGTPLDELLQRSGPLPLERFVPLFERLCEVIQSAHEQGIVHRDIKPSNVMVISRAGRLLPKLLDFGIAKPMTASIVTPGDPAAPASRHRSISDSCVLERDDTVDASRSLGTPGSLTHRGEILGSPLYMAPEQWLHAEIAGPPADQYALALLAYETLTGSRAVEGATIEALAHQHLHAPLPALPAEFPPAIHRVLARATDKVPECRFATLTELASTLRMAAGIGASELDEAIPGLPIELSAVWISDAPRPIAESIAALASARTLTRADERIAAIASLLARWVGVLAVACRSKLGRADDAASIATELLIALRHRTLLDGEWLDLAVVFARFHAEHPETWPVPEMVTFLMNDDAVRGLRRILRTGVAGAIDDVIARGALESRIAQLAAVLDSLDWLLDYALARELPDGLELWMGRRSDDRLLHRVVSDGSGAVVVLDGCGARLARLSPLVQFAAPMPGEAEELFVFAGPGRSDVGARFISHPRGFEREDDQVWTWLAEHVLETEPQKLASPSDDLSPYPGLAAYTLRDHESFVGRERDVEELLNRLRTHALVTVVGPSGIGKTSFLAAGVVPALGPSWQSELVRPGNDPVGALAGIADRINAPAYRDGTRAPATTAAGIAAALAGLAEQRGTHLVVLVDQAEELFTMCTDEVARDVFAEALAIAATHSGIRVVITMRDDFLCRADNLAAWRGRIGSSVQLLRVPSRTDLERMIAVPARRRGYEFDDATLPAEIAAAVADRPGALPLVAFTAATLWEHRDRHFSQMRRATYEQIGGVTGALVSGRDPRSDAGAASKARPSRVPSSALHRGDAGADRPQRARTRARRNAGGRDRCRSLARRSPAGLARRRRRTSDRDHSRDTRDDLASARELAARGRGGNAATAAAVRRGAALGRTAPTGRPAVAGRRARRFRALAA